GLGWARERQGRCGEAVLAFRKVLAIDPADPGALAGLDRCARRRLRGTAALTVAGQRLAGAYGLSASPALDLLFAERVSIGATYRFRYLPMAAAGVTPARQHEAYARIG